MTPFDFLKLLWERKPENDYILIWTLQDKRSHWFRSPARAAEFVGSHQTDVYVGVGVSSQDCGPHRRCRSVEIAGIPGFGVDLDIKSPAHPKELPASIEEALTLIPESLPPTIIIATGNGIQAWWLFKEPWIFENDAERTEAAMLSRRFQALFGYSASQKGWAFERLADLARVLRIAGTTNGKDPDHPKQITVHSFDGRRYNPSELEDFLDDQSIPDPDAEQDAARNWRERFADRPLVINLGARIPQEMIDRWCDADPRFKHTWFRQRADLNDQSQSGYDMALAWFGVALRLDEQQIADLIIHHRSIHHQKTRAKIDYFQRTISKAAKGRSESADSPHPESPSTHRIAEFMPADPLIAKAQVWDRISTILGIRIYRVVKITGKDPIYRMELEGAKIEFPTTKKFVTQDSVRCAIAAASNHYPPRQKLKAWEEIVLMMLGALTEEDGGEEMDLEGRARMYLSQYLSAVGFIDAISAERSQNDRGPMIVDGTITVCSNDFQIYVNKSTNQNLSIREIAAMLSVVGGRTFRFHRGTADQTRWKLPPREFDPSTYSAQYREDVDHAD